MSNNRIQLYMDTLAYYQNSEYELFNKKRKDAGLTVLEKKLLAVRILVIEKKWDEIINLFENVNTEEIFYKAEMNFFKAFASRYLNDFQTAVVCDHKALSYFELCDDKSACFSSAYSLWVDYQRIGMIDLAFHYLNYAGNYVSTKRDECKIYRGKACYYTNIGEKDKALVFIEQALKYKNHLSMVNQSILYTVAADVFFKNGKEKRALALLKKVHNKKINHEKAQVSLHIHLLKKMESGESLGEMPEIIRSTKEYALKWELIYYIERGDLDTAKLKWNELKLASPHLYGSFLEYKDESISKSIFNQYIVRTIQRETCEVKTSNTLGNLKGKKSNLLVGFLIEKKLPVCKEILIEKVWKKPYSPELDNRFYKLVQRLKAMGVQIDNQNNSYYLAS